MKNANATEKLPNWYIDEVIQALKELKREYTDNTIIADDGKNYSEIIDNKNKENS